MLPIVPEFIPQVQSCAATTAGGGCRWETTALIGYGKFISTKLNTITDEQAKSPYEPH